MLIEVNRSEKTVVEALNRRIIIQGIDAFLLEMKPGKISSSLEVEMQETASEQ